MTARATARVTMGAVLAPGRVEGPQVRRVPSRLVAARGRELLSGARREHLGMYAAMSVDEEAVRRALPAARERHLRGVLLRTLAPVGAATPRVDAADLAVIDGDHRRAATLPTSLNIVDRRVALLPADPADPDGDHLEVWAPALVAGLLAMFERHWTVAAPPELSARERAVVELLAEGCTDAVVARRLGVSERTVTATVRVLLDRYGARSRFQLALALAVRTW